jgi:putative membrane protein
MKLILRWAALALSFWVATALIPGINVLGGFTTYLWVALLFGLLNATLGSFLKLLTLPAVILTLGLFLVVVNAAILMLVARWSDKLDVTNFWSAVLAALVISVVTRLVSGVTKKALPL